MLFLILAHVGDETAIQVYAMLRARYGEEQVKLVSSEELVFAPYWMHLLEDMQVITDIHLSNGVLLNSLDIGVVFNRLHEMTMLHFSTEVDRDYATREMTALCLSWLASLPCPVVNRPTPTGLGAQTRSHAEWLFLAGKAGFSVQGYHSTTDPRWCREKTYVPYRWQLFSKDNPRVAFEKVSAQSVSRLPTLYLEPLSECWQSILVAGDYAVGNLAEQYSAQAIYLASLSGCDLLEITFASVAVEEGGQTAHENWKVFGVSSFPYVKSAESISAIVQLLETKREEYHLDSVARLRS